MYFVDEKHVVRLEGSEDACKVAGLVEHWSARQLKAYSELVCYDVGQRRLSQAWRSVQKCVVERFASVLRRLDEDAEVLDDLLLSTEVLEA